VLSQPRVSVLIPTYNQARFAGRALNSLLAQDLHDWEAIIVDDGSTDATAAVVAPYLRDPRVCYHRLPENRGLGAALNAALARASTPYIAYLPTDDLYYPNHLSALLHLLERHPRAVAAYSGIRHHVNEYAAGKVPGYPLQLVQVMHRRTSDRWVERDELVTDDLDRLYWSKLRPGRFIRSGLATCEWVDHPDQMHKAIREPVGGVNRFRARYQVQRPMHFHSSVADPFDEVDHYRRFRERPSTPPAPDGLKILLVGELAFNPERVLALEERGHRLYGLWTTDGWGFNTVGPLPFGHVEDLPRADWQSAVRRIKPDVIYAMLNWQAVPFAHHVLLNNPGVPFVWHFKEGPFVDKGIWPALVDLQTRSDGQIYSSPELRDWFALALPGGVDPDRSLTLDGDLPKQDWFTDDRRPRLSEQDGEPHTVVTGRPLGLTPDVFMGLAKRGIHIHLYGNFLQKVARPWARSAQRAGGRFVHLHRPVHQGQWVRELSQYDAGWLHLFRSKNEGDLRRAHWDDLNYPARISTLLAAGLPLIQRDNSGAIVATQTLAHSLDIGLFFSDFTDLRARLLDTTTMARLRSQAWEVREQFTFDHHADRLIAFFRRVVGHGARPAPVEVHRNGVRAGGHSRAGTVVAGSPARGSRSNGTG
jgi:hypothetical protein